MERKEGRVKDTGKKQKGASCLVKAQRWRGEPQARGGTSSPARLRPPSTASALITDPSCKPTGGVKVLSLSLAALPGPRTSWHAAAAGPCLSSASQWSNPQIKQKASPVTLSLALCSRSVGWPSWKATSHLPHTCGEEGAWEGTETLPVLLLPC